jgi:ribose/xylose/arabinose/galactoside ABC-type transport system permease subunit
MTVWKTEYYANSPKQQAYLDLAALAGLAAAPGILFNWLMPLPFMPPVICVVSFLMACAFGWFAYHTGADRRSARFTAWDIAGIFAVLWAGAGFASDPKYLVQLFEILARAS